MPLRRAVLVSAIAVSSWPVVCAQASDTPAVAQSPAASPQAQPAAYHVELPPANGRVAPARSAPQDSLRQNDAVLAASASARPATFAPAYVAPVAAKPTLNLDRGPAAPRTGWEMSGRVGPLRWLAPLEGEGETQVRLGGRIQNQPRIPNMPPLNVGIHYSFE